MARAQIYYFFGFTSPFVALADWRMDALLAPFDVEVIPIPIVPQWTDPPSGPAEVMQRWKLRYNLEDATRTARLLGMPWTPPTSSFRADSTDAVAGWYCARAHGCERAYRRAVLQARWGAGRDIADHAVLDNCARAAGLEIDAFRAALRARRYDAEIAGGHAISAEHKVFGVPLFSINGERFWGNDRLEILIDSLRKQADG